MEGTILDEHDMEALRLPTGRFLAPELPLSSRERQTFIDEIAALPSRLRGVVSGLSEARLDTPYRPGGWTVRQVVHHLPDSHMNAYVRFKLAVTETEPTITTYDEAAWAELPDGRGAEVEESLLLLDALHGRWSRFLGSLSPEDFRRALRHPDMGVVMLDTLLALYAWHGRHHLAHLARLREREGW